jgi:hypothetical protein
LDSYILSEVFLFKKIGLAGAYKFPDFIESKIEDRASPSVNRDVSEFLQLVRNIAFFVAVRVGKPHGMMELWPPARREQWYDGSKEKRNQNS